MSMIMLTGLFGKIYADVMIPEDQILGYYDSEGIYTIVGVVKNTEKYAILPVIHLTILDNGKEISISQSLPTVFPNKDIPFKIKSSEITAIDASITNFDVTFSQVFDKLESKVEVVYDRTLKKHADGHLTGKIINKGNQTQYDVKIYATIHGENNSFIDTAKNLERIDKIDPGQIIDFTMYPDSIVAQDIHYYSCFAIGDETIIPLYAVRNGEKFNFRYDSTASFSVDGGFDETGTVLSLTGVNSFKFPTYVNFEFPKTSDNEKFKVVVNGKVVQFLQSIDEEGSWHVVFDVSGSTQNKIMISGFEKPGSTHTSTNPVTVESSEPVDEVQDMQAESLDGADYSVWYYIAPIIIAGVIGITVFSIRKAKSKV